MPLLQILVNGILLGCLYGVIAVGFSLVWGVMNIINVAHGALLMVGAYITFWMFHLWGVDPFATIPVSMVALFAAGYLLQRYLFNRLVRAPIFMTFILTFGVALIIENLSLYAFTAEYRSARPAYASAIVDVGGFSVPAVRIVLALIAIALTSALFAFMARTKIGLAIRATRMNLESAKLMGVKIGTIYAITFGLGAALAGAAGSLMSIAYVISPVMGPGYLLRAFTICILGGLGNVYGALVGGLLFGVVESLGGLFLGTGLQEVIGMVMLVIVLVFRPSGIMGKRFYEI
jgi:branched-chain amino acid transport system permease protein